MSLIESLKTEQQETHARALETYCEVLQRDADPQPGDAKRLREAMATLGYGADRLTADLDVLRQAATLERETSAWTQELSDQADAAAEEATAYRNRTEIIVREREQEQRELDGRVRTLSDRQSQAREAGRKLVVLRQTHRELFGLPEPEPTAEPDLASHSFPVLPLPAEDEATIRSRRPIQDDNSLLPRPPRAGGVPTSGQRQAAEAAEA